MKRVYGLGIIAGAERKQVLVKNAYNLVNVAVGLDLGKLGSG